MRKLPFLSILVTIALGQAHAETNAFNRKYRDIEDELFNLAIRFTATEVFDLGPNDSGQIIRGLKIGNGPVKNLVVATHHGNEYGSTEVALALMTSLAASPLAGQTTFVIPVLNVPGYDRRKRLEGAIDPNRDYPGPCGPSTFFSLRSTHALAEFVERENIVTTATLHTHAYAASVACPWGHPTPHYRTDVDTTFVRLALASVSSSNYKTGQSSAILENVRGAYEDYVFWKMGVWSLLFELGYSHFPDAAAIEELIRVNVPGIRRFLAEAPKSRSLHHAFTGECN